MKRTLTDIMTELKALNPSIKQLLAHADYENYEDLSGLEIDRADAEQLFLLDELQKLLYKLDDVSYTLNYLCRPVKVEGVLHKNSTGRYEVNGYELTSGNGIEYLATDDRHMRYNTNDDYVPTPYWKASRIEHDGKDYYIVGASDLNTLENVRVRIR